MTDGIDDEKLLLMRALYSVLDSLGAMTSVGALYGSGLTDEEILEVVDARELLFVAKEQGVIA